MKKTDIHLHVRLQDSPPEQEAKRSGAQSMVNHMQALGIEKGIILSGSEKTWSSSLSNNEECAEICARFPQYTWMCNIDPVDPETVYDRLKRYQSQGAVGIGELMINKRLDDPFFTVLFEAAQALRMPILFHMTPEVGLSYGVVDESGLPLLEQALQQYPDLIFIGHSVTFWVEISGDAPKDRDGRNQYFNTPVTEGGRIPVLMSTYPNLYADLSAGSGGGAMMRDPAFGVSFLEKYASQLFFGTDMLYTGQKLPLANWMETQCQQGALSKEACEKIFYQNAQRIFHW